MQSYLEKQAISRINHLAKTKTPFLFIINYDKTESYIEPLDTIDPNIILYNIGARTNQKIGVTRKIDTFLWQKEVCDFQTYLQSFNPLMESLYKNKISLINLTFSTPISTNLSLASIYHQSKAKYKLWLKDQFVCFSPETFINIKNGIISSFPMKGTISTLIPNAEILLIDNPKEQDEHQNIVQLTKEDLARIANHITVPRYRFIDRVETNHGAILQTSSEIQGQLPEDYHLKLGDILFSLLPAASITGSPKAASIKLINQYEQHSRHFYTGVAGYFDGNDLESFVLIRFIEQNGTQLIYKSGGGITAQSDAYSEYEELKQKVYVPIY